VEPSLLCTALLSLLATAPPARDESVYPEQEWTTRKPADVGLDEDRLREFSRFVGGRGCVVRHGYLVHSWGDAAERGDVASAAKPVYAHFLFKALEDKRIPDLDEKVVRYEPGLGRLNKTLDFKDAAITWRHLATQTSCYGVGEKPGTAFDYSDYQMSLFWDLLFLKVYSTTPGTADAKVLRHGLADLLQCQDAPTFMAFGTKNRPGRLAISPRDFARFGLLYLRQGRWRDRQLIAKEHVRQAIATPLSNDVLRTRGKRAEMLPGQRSIGGGNNQTDHLGSYSYLWWTNGTDRDGKRHWPDVPADVYGAFGHGGQRALVILPSLDLVVSWNDARVENRDAEGRALKLLIVAARTR
jgi:CubicO group peptidase (beta-lactamase class C family)